MKIFTGAVILMVAIAMTSCVRDTRGIPADPFILFESAAGSPVTCDGISEHNRHLGDRGSYFYALDIEGRVVCHPNRTLTGRDLSRFPFVKEVLTRRNGCLSYESAGTRIAVIFRENENLMLCLSANTMNWPADYSPCLSVEEE